jgi:hypothetical protein
VSTVTPIPSSKAAFLGTASNWKRGCEFGWGRGSLTISNSRLKPSGKQAQAHMAKLRLQPVVLDHRKGEIVHYGRIRELTSEQVHEAKAEADAIRLLHGINCLQILNEDEAVVAFKMTNPETGLARWA